MIKGYTVGKNEYTGELYLTIFPESGDPISLREKDLIEVKDSINTIFSFLETVKSPEEQEKDKLIGIINEKTTDEEKLAIIDIYEEWKNLIGKKVNADAFFKHEGILYRVIKDNTTIYEHYLPQETPSEYEDMTKKILQPDGSYPLWVQPAGSHDAYKIGDKVQHNGFNWECIEGDASGLNTWEPSLYGWKQI